MPPKSILSSGRSSVTSKGKDNTLTKKVKELPKELCGCGADTYRPPPKGKKKLAAPVEHNSGCVYQRTTCQHYPHLPKCSVCESPCKYCCGMYRWCPHCYEHQCEYRYKRVVHGEEPAWIDAGPGNGIMNLIKPAGRRATTVTFAANNHVSNIGMSTSTSTSPFVEKADNAGLASMPNSRLGMRESVSANRIK